MAAIRAHDNVLAITSGNSIAVIDTRNPTHFQPFKIPVVKAEKSGVKKEKESSEAQDADDDDAAGGPDEGSLENRTLALGLSGGGRYLAVCDDRKYLHLYLTGDGDCRLLSSRILVRRATSLTFTLDEATVVVADKSGDVYAFPVTPDNQGQADPEVKDQGDVKGQDDTSPEVKGQLLLGHLSMVLDVCLAHGDRYVVTCDRDEKVRLSRYPNAYNVHCYCLGHTQFVSCLKYVDEFQILLSGSGDCSVRAWDMEGRQLCVAHCPVEQPAIAASPGAGQAKNGDREDKERQAETGRVAVQGLAYCTRCRLLVVSFHSLAELQVYRLGMTGGEASLTLLQTIPLSVCPWDVTFDDEYRTLWVLSPLQGETLSAYRLKGDENDEKHLQFCRVTDEEKPTWNTLTTVNSQWDFFSDSVGVASSIPGLWKQQGQDNVADYQQRKQQRLRGQARGQKRVSPTGSVPQGQAGEAPAGVVPEDAPEKRPRVP